MSSKPGSADPSWAKVLIVNHEEMVLSVLKSQLQPEGYHITTEKNASKALEILDRESFSVILADQELPELSGLDLLAKVKGKHPSVTRLLVSSGLSMTELTDAIKAETIYRFLTKPWLREELLVTMRNAISHGRLVSENRSLHERNIQLNLKISKMAEAAAAEEEADNGGEVGMPTLDDVFATSDSPTAMFVPPPPGVDLAIEAFTKMLYTFHPNLGNTSLRAVALCQTLGEVLELPGAELKSLIWAAAMHDIALVGIDRGIVRRWLRGPEKCTEEEMVLIKRHPEHAQKMLEEFPYFQEAGEIIRSHHESWDGTGYPDGLKGEMIPKLARLLSVVVSYCSKHSTSIQAMSEIEAGKETLYDEESINAVAKAAPLTKMPRGEREILLIELKQGMTLAREIYNANGFLLLPKGREMTEASINKVWSINRITPIDPLVLVYC